MAKSAGRSALRICCTEFITSLLIAPGQIRSDSDHHMHKSNSIIMRAPKMSIFETAADLELWPKILPHYRYIRFLERGADRNVVVMAAKRSRIPISWTSEQIINRDKMEAHFHHLK